jgi:hypothetical protein
MQQRMARLLLTLAGLAALVGCVTVAVGKVEPALFPDAAVASAAPLAGRVALVLPPALREQIHGGPIRTADPIKRLQLPLGAVVDAALRRQLAVAFSGGVQPAALPLPLGAGVDVAVAVSAARLDLDTHLNWFVPLPLPAFFPVAQSTDHIATLALDLRITAADGRVLAETTVDSGRVVLERGIWTTETRLDLCQKLLHQAAWQAAAQAARVVRETLKAERQRERAL